jgi:hypothetical protein
VPKACAAYWISAGSVRVILLRNCVVPVGAAPIDETNDNKTPTPEKITLLKYTPVTSCDTERSFSAYKHILSHKRQSMTPENTEKILILYCA